MIDLEKKMYEKKLAEHPELDIRNHLGGIVYTPLTGDHIINHIIGICAASLLQNLMWQYTQKIHQEGEELIVPRVVLGEPSLMPNTENQYGDFLNLNDVNYAKSLQGLGRNGAMYGTIGAIWRLHSIIFDIPDDDFREFDIKYCIPLDQVEQSIGQYGYIVNPFVAQIMDIFKYRYYPEGFASEIDAAWNLCHTMWDIGLNGVLQKGIPVNRRIEPIEIVELKNGKMLPIFADGVGAIGADIDHRFSDCAVIGVQMHDAQDGSYYYAISSNFMVADNFQWTWEVPAEYRFGAGKIHQEMPYDIMSVSVDYHTITFWNKESMIKFVEEKVYG